MSAPTRVHPIARAVLWGDVVVTFLSGLALYPLARRADTSFAWTIKAPITAAFLGAGYWGAMLGITIAAMTREWQRVRIVFVIGTVLTTLMLIPTFVYIDQFHLDEGSARAKQLAWFWLILYLVQPPVVFTLFVLQERAGGRRERDVEEPLLGWFRWAVLAQAIGLAAVAVALWPLRADGFWPWALPDLGAAAVAVWIITFAAGLGWCLYERDWRRARVVFPAYLAFLLLLLVAAARFSDAFDGGAWQTWAWLAVTTLSLAVLGAGAVQHELISRRRAKTAGSPTITQPA
jgi:hypothetical protein